MTDSPQQRIHQPDNCPPDVRLHYLFGQVRKGIPYQKGYDYLALAAEDLHMLLYHYRRAATYDDALYDTLTPAELHTLVDIFGKLVTPLFGQEEGLRLAREEHDKVVG